MAEPGAARVSGSSDPIDADRWQQIQDLLADVIDCSPSQRAALLERRCAHDRSLRAEVESLLIAHEREGVVDELTPLLQQASALVRKPLAEWSGRRIGQYLVQEPIGSGGMAVIYKARDERLQRQVALKFLSPYLSADADAKSRFLAEARTAAALDHQNVCTIYEIGETDDGHLFIAMPLYDGETLQARLTRGRLTFAEALPLALQIARGLEHAHAAGIVHRDIKPSNIVILHDGTPKIVDFGIARMHDSPHADPNALIGTASYMSPEQADGGPIDRRSDIWSLGIVLHELVSGTRPFEGDDLRSRAPGSRHESEASTRRSNRFCRSFCTCCRCTATSMPSPDICAVNTCRPLCSTRSLLSSACSPAVDRSLSLSRMGTGPTPVRARRSCELRN
jgi:serine/threonine-protein kinase